MSALDWFNGGVTAAHKCAEQPSSSPLGGPPLSAMLPRCGMVHNGKGRRVEALHSLLPQRSSMDIHACMPAACS